jgi:hypothetical protein
MTNKYYFPDEMHGLLGNYLHKPLDTPFQYQTASPLWSRSDNHDGLDSLDFITAGSVLSMATTTSSTASQSSSAYALLQAYCKDLECQLDIEK